MSTVMSRRGQISIPAEIREKADFREGDRFEWFYDGKTVTLVRVPRNPLQWLPGSTKGMGLYDALMDERKQERDRA